MHHQPLRTPVTPRRKMSNVRHTRHEVTFFGSAADADFGRLF